MQTGSAQAGSVFAFGTHSKAFFVPRDNIKSVLYFVGNHVRTAAMSFDLPRKHLLSLQRLLHSAGIFQKVSSHGVGRYRFPITAWCRRLGYNFTVSQFV